MIKIIYLHSTPPAYHLYQDKERPYYNWDTLEGQWVGIWGYDWGDLLGREVLKHDEAFVFEVWQPDYRADRIYEAKLDSGVIHKLFPAKNRRYFNGLKYKEYLTCDQMIRELARVCQNDQNVVIQVNGKYYSKPLIYKIVRDFKAFPIVLTFHGEMKLAYQELWKFTKNVFSKWEHILQFFLFKKSINWINAITYQVKSDVAQLQGRYHGLTEQLTMGVDFDFWQPGNKKRAREILGLPQDIFIFYFSANLVPRKQLDYFIKVLNKLPDSYRFLLLVSGHGHPKYQKYLNNLARPLMNQHKLIFTGYLSDQEKLKVYYDASDCFVTVSRAEAGPVSAMKALAMGVPVLTTNTGNVADFLEDTQTGMVVGRYNYDQWFGAISSILLKGQVVATPRNKAMERYDWSYLANRFIRIYRQTLKN